MSSNLFHNVSENKPFHIYKCEDTIDGIFTAIYDAWSSRYGHEYNKIQIDGYDNNLELFSEYIVVKTDIEKSIKVARSIKSKISTRAYEIVTASLLSENADKAQCAYYFLIIGFSVGSDVINQLHNPYIYRVFEMNRYIFREIDKYYGFIRFCEIDNDILLSEISPNNNILQLLNNHFHERMYNENWIIFDSRRHIALIHKAKEDSYLLSLSLHENNALCNLYKSNNSSDNIKNLWSVFFDSIAIKERKNSNLQRQMLPIRYRNKMIEFNNN